MTLSDTWIVLIIFISVPSGGMPSKEKEREREGEGEGEREGEREEG